jgi:hypothetical protein
MDRFGRRTFLTRGGKAVAAAGLVSAIPGLTSMVAAGEAEAPAEASTADAALGDMTEPIVAHVRDLATGEITLFSGTSEVVVRDPQLANRLFQAGR